MLNGVESVKIVRNNGVAYQLLICIFISFIAFYTNFRVIIKKNQIESLSALIWYVLAIFAGASVLVYAVTEIRLLSNSPPIPKQIAFGAVFFYFSVSVAYALAKNSMFYHQRHQQLIIDKKQAELTLLRNQLQPHFLFNALNNLLSMVNRSENPKLVSSIDKLSNLFICYRR
jgi:sensor histidine kinase YesM